MSYTINLTNGNVLTTIPDGTINTNSCSQTLVGKNYAGYGQFLDDNFVHLLENAANSTPPSVVLKGQLWYNTSTTVLSVYNGAVFKPLGVLNNASSAPTGNNSVGDLWYDNSNQQLNVWTGSVWLLIGPIYTAATGITGAIPTTITDNSQRQHVVVELYTGGNIVGMISQDATFTPATAITGFANIHPGIQLSTTISSGNAVFYGTTTNAQSLQGLLPSQIMRSDINTGTTGTLSVSNNGNATRGSTSAFRVGLNSDFGINVANNNVSLTNYDLNGNISLFANVSGTLTSCLSINGATGNVTARNVQAVYADVAERFEADALYEAGTVVELGGVAEITQSNTDLSENVFGVISTNAAYLMNSQAGDSSTHPPVAMTGRVPVKVTGIIQKGERLVSAGDGMARAAKPGEATAFNVIGRALVAKLDSGVGTVEAIVTIK
jgi:hypothetical protein